MEYMHLGHRIKQARENQNLTREQLAAKIAVKTKTVKHWEEEHTIPRVNKLNTIAGVLDVPLLWLLAGSDNPPDTRPSSISVDATVQQKLQQAEQCMAELATLLSEAKLLMANKNN